MLENSGNLGNSIDQLTTSEKSYIISPKRNAFQINFRTNSIQQYNNDFSREESKLFDFIEDCEKDQTRFNNMKDLMKDKFFKISFRRNNRLDQHKLFDYGKPPNKLQNHSNIFPTSSFLSERKRPSTRKDFSRQIQRVLDVSMQMRNSESKFTRRQNKIKTRSELDKKNQEIIEKQKDLIMRFVKKSNSAAIPEKKWSEISNKEKFTMNFMEYNKRKTQRQIEKYIYENKLKQKKQPLEKFQNFILEEVQFSSDHKNKLSVFFNKMSEEFRRVQKHKQ